MKYLVRVKSEHDCWLADINGDPGRTRIKASAKRYDSKILAEAAKSAKEVLFPFRSYIVENAT